MTVYNKRDDGVWLQEVMQGIVFLGLRYHSLLIPVRFGRACVCVRVFDQELWSF